jgi:hypothetical protein
MHQERSVAKSIISMRFDVTGFSKDNINAMKDLAILCNHPSLKCSIQFEADKKKRDT